jgi:cell division protease FtsH
MPRTIQSPCRARAAKYEWAPVNDALSTQSVYPDDPPDAKSGQAKQPQVWKPERLNELSYTQFLVLVREGHVERVKFSYNMSKMTVTTTATCPSRPSETATIGVAYDPHLYPLLSAAGVAVEAPSDAYEPAAQLITGALYPFIAVMLLLTFAMALGRSLQSKSAVFGGARLELIQSEDVGVAFDDVAGIDEIKGEITEIVSFLKDQARPCRHSALPA